MQIHRLLEQASERNRNNALRFGAMTEKTWSRILFSGVLFLILFPGAAYIGYQTIGFPRGFSRSGAIFMEVLGISALVLYVFRGISLRKRI